MKPAPVCISRTSFVPKEILHLEEEIEKIKQSKNQVVKNQNFEEAARLRDLEKKLLSDLENCQT